MILELNPQVSEQEVTLLIDFLNQKHPPCIHIPSRNRIVTTALVSKSEIQKFETTIRQIIPTTSSFPLASVENTNHQPVLIDDNPIGGDLFTVMAGPCSVENEQQVFETAAFLQKLGIRYIRGGAYKPRTSPYSFRGLGKPGLELLSRAAKAHDLKVVTEILDLNLLDEVSEYADVLQVGSRNMQNFYLLHALGKTNKPILLKRGMHAKVKEWLLAAEYILSGGNERVILCERGIRSFDPESRNVMDLGVIPLIKELSHLPVIADPSHGTGYASRVAPMALAASVAGADGLLIEIHPNPSAALSDKHQAMDFDSFERLYNQLIHVLPVAGKKLLTETSVLKLQSL